MKRRISFLLVLVLLLATAVPLVAQAEITPPTINNGEPVTLRVQMGSFNPTLNTEPTAEQPNVLLSTQRIADEFMKLHPNVTIEWDRSEPTEPTEASIAQMIVTQLAAGTAADIMNNVFGAAVYSDREWFMVLNDVIKTPNEYVEGNESWADQFPSYVWNEITITDPKGRILSVPYTSYTGPPTAYYYNVDLFKELGVEVPTDWEEFLAAAKVFNDAGYVGIAPEPGNKLLNVRVWDIQFSLGPVYGGKLMDVIDYDKSGKVDPQENIRAIKEGYFDTLRHDYAKEIWQQVKRKYTECLQEGYENIDYEPLWNEGKVAMLEAGIWRLPDENANTERKFEFSLFPAPIITETTSQNVAKVEYTEKGPYHPKLGGGFNIIEPSIQAHGGEGVREAAVAFIKYMCVPENISQLMIERRGAELGVVKGCAIAPDINSWLSNSFPILPGADWNIADFVISEARDEQNRLFEQWVKGMIEDDEFYTQLDAVTQKGTDDYITKTEIDTTGWNIAE